MTSEQSPPADPFAGWTVERCPACGRIALAWAPWQQAGDECGCPECREQIKLLRESGKCRRCREGR